MRLADLAAEPFILFPDSYKLREVTLPACRAAGIEPKVALDGGATQCALEFVASGLGMALVPELALRRARGVRGVSIADQDLRRSLGVAWRKGHCLSPAARALRDFLSPACGACGPAIVLHSGSSLIAFVQKVDG